MTFFRQGDNYAIKVNGFSTDPSWRVGVKLKMNSNSKILKILKLK